MIHALVLCVTAAAAGSTGYAGAIASPLAEPQAVAERRIRAAHLIALRAVARVRMAVLRAGWETGGGVTSDPEGARPVNWQLEDHVNREEHVESLVPKTWRLAADAEAERAALAGRIAGRLPRGTGRGGEPAATLRPADCSKKGVDRLVVCAEAAALAAVRAAQAAELDADRAIALGRRVQAPD